MNESVFDPESVRTILATDCGSTTTKAILIERIGGEYRLTTRGEAPTTVESPFDDVTVGVVNAVREVEELSGKTLLNVTEETRGATGKSAVITPQQSDTTGADLYLSTSSAGGGLQMSVAGVVKTMSAESANRAALGAGAIVIDTVAVDDGRKDYEKVERIRQLRPDMLLMSGGTDGGTVTHLVDIAQMLVAADPRPRLGVGLRIPVIFAGNKDAVEPVKDVLDDRVDLKVVDNLRPAMDRENLGPAREAIHELFLQHVMQQAPGYGKLMTWTSAGIMSTPNAVGKIIETIADQLHINVLAVDIGGATTDVFSVFNGIFNRTVSANLGMSYSICNVLTETGIENIQRWMPFSISDDDLRNRLRNKMIRPTTVPQGLDDLLIEQAVSREALRLAFDHHKSLARGLKGVQKVRTVGEAISQEASGATLVNLVDLNMIVGSGGVLSHAPHRGQTALMMLDAYQPQGITMLAVDSIFMMPQLGILSTVHPAAAAQVFERDCLIKLGDSICAVGPGGTSGTAFSVSVNGEDISVQAGELKVVPLGLGETRVVTVHPGRGWNVGAGKNKALENVTVEGGIVGLVLDGRGRPIALPPAGPQRTAKLTEWLKALGLPSIAS
ncbi:MAG TPA: glutamate mutase L [Armatimonadota bacterium]